VPYRTGTGSIELIEDHKGPLLQRQRERSTNFYWWDSPFAPSWMRSEDCWMATCAGCHMSDSTNRWMLNWKTVWLIENRITSGFPINELPILIIFTSTIRSSHRPHRRLYSRWQSLRRRMATAINRLLWHVAAVRWSIQSVTDDSDSYNFNRVLKRKKRLI
jgi:hypothetical protein